MTTSTTGQSVSRRTAIAGLGAGGLGVAFSATVRHVAAQDAAEMAKHPVVGLWQNAVTGPDAAERPWTFGVFHADGTYQDWGGLATGTGLGLWRPTGERTADLLSVVQDTDPTSATDTSGTATFRMAVEVDATDDAMTLAGTLDVQAPDGGLIVAIPEARWTASRVTFDRNPATGSTSGTATAATPTA